MRVGQPVVATFPRRGVHTASGYRDVPEGATHDALNVRMVDRTGRERGGKRPGTHRYFGAAMTAGSGSDHRINRMAALHLSARAILDPVTELDSASPVQRFQYANTNDFGDFGDATWAFAWRAGTASVVNGYGVSPRLFSLFTAYSNDYRECSSNTQATVADDFGAGFGSIGALCFRPAGYNDVTAEFACGSTHGINASDSLWIYYSCDWCGPFVRADSATIPTEFICAYLTHVGGEAEPGGGNYPPGSVRLVIAKADSGSLTALAAGPAFVPGGVDLFSAASPLVQSRDRTFEIRLRATATRITAELFGWEVDGTPMIPADISGGGLSDGGGYKVEVNNTDLAANNKCGVMFRVVNNGMGRRTVRSVHPIANAANAQPAAVGGEDDKIAIIASYLKDRTYIARTDLRRSTSGIFTSGLRAIAGASTSGHAGTLVSACVAFRRFFSVDGLTAKVVDPIADTETAWIASVGEFPLSPRVVALYRGRLVLATGADWFMSRVADWTDWDYGATPEATSAQNGISTDVGQVGDEIVALLPMSDDYLVFGCVGSMWVLTGDTAANGTIECLSYEIGMLSEAAYCYDGRGACHFMSQVGHCRMERGGTGPSVPVRVSAGRVKELEDIDPDVTIVTMAYDSVDDYIHIFLTPRDGSSVGSHWIYGVGSDEYWPERYDAQTTTRFGPTAAVGLRCALAADRRVAMGGFDGHVRRHRVGAGDDDMAEATAEGTLSSGVAVAARVDLPMIRLGAEGYVRPCVTEMMFAGAAGNSAVTIEVFGGAAEEAAAASVSAISSHTATGDPLSLKRVRLRANVLRIRLSTAAAGALWSMEALTAWVRGMGRIRGD